jgi:hypothetical protein
VTPEGCFCDYMCPHFLSKNSLSKISLFKILE